MRFKKTAIATGLVALVLGVATLAPNLTSSKRVEVHQTQVEQVKLKENEKKKILYDAIFNYNYEFFNGTRDFEGFVSYMDRGSLWKGYSNEIKSNIEFYARENRKKRKLEGDLDKEDLAVGKEAVVQGYVGLQKMCLDLAVLKLNSEVSEKDLANWAENAVIHMENVVKIKKVDEKHPAVLKGYEVFLDQRSGWYEKIIREGLKNPRLDEILKQAEQHPEDKSFVFRSLIKEMYKTFDEFEKEINQYEETRMALYRTFIKSLIDNYHGWKAGFVKALVPVIAVNTCKRGEEINRVYAKKIYNEN